MSVWLWATSHWVDRYSRTKERLLETSQNIRMHTRSTAGDFKLYQTNVNHECACTRCKLTQVYVHAFSLNVWNRSSVPNYSVSVRKTRRNSHISAIRTRLLWSFPSRQNRPRYVLLLLKLTINAIRYFYDQFDDYSMPSLYIIRDSKRES